jgi:hypothetical protein
VIYSTPTATVLPKDVEWLGKLYTLYASLLGIDNDSLDGDLINILQDHFRLV